MEEALGGLLRPCIESRHAYQALKSLATHKTDRNDARGLAHLARTGFYKPVNVKSLLYESNHAGGRRLQTALPAHRHRHQRRRSLVRRTSFNSRLSRVTKSSVACKRACSSRMLA